MERESCRTDVLVAGGGLAGVATALELLDRGIRVLLIDAGREEEFGGQARRAFGGMLLVDTPIQRRNHVRDSKALALRDWLSFAEFGDDDLWPRRWAEHYIERCIPDVFEWLRAAGVGFFQAVQWPEKGLYVAGNSVPRYHVIWGTSRHMALLLIERLRQHPRAATHLTLRFGHRLEQLEQCNGRVGGGLVKSEHGAMLDVTADHVVLASGGITGNLDLVRRHWPAGWPAAPATLLNGNHPKNDGRMHAAVQALGGRLTHLDRHWNYASGVRHPQPHYDDEGLSLIPCRSALWMDYRGRRIGPQPLVTGYDTRYLCEQVTRQPRPYTWQVMNRRIALKELAASGAEHNPSIRDRKLLPFLKEVLLGNHGLYRELTEHCQDFIVAGSVAELAGRMNTLTASDDVDAGVLEDEIRQYDERIARGQSFHNDDQLRRIAQLRGWSGDRVRTCNFQRILDKSAAPLVAVRLSLLTRKSLGGMQTDLDSRVLDVRGQALLGLYAVGEAAGFGGGGISGLRSLEGHCLPACILTGQAAARAIGGAAAL